LEPAGAENMLLSIARNLDRKRFYLMVGYIYGPGTLATELKRAGVQVIDLSREGKIDPWVIVKLFLLIRREKVKIVHTHLVHASIVGRVAAKLAGVKILVTTRHYAYDLKEKSFICWLERKLAGLNRMTIAISKAVRDYLIRTENYDCKKVTVIYNTVDLRLIDSEAPVIISRNQNDFLIGSVGQLHPSKGYDTLLKSMPQVIKEFPSVKLIIIGDGIQREYLERLCSDLGISQRVSFRGRKMPAEVLGFLKNIDLFVLASNWEGFGLALIEAMSSGKPVVATKVGGIPEIVEDGECGFLVPPGDPQALAEKVIYLLRNRDLATEMGKEGRKRVETLFSLDNMIVKLEGLYQDLLNQEKV